MRERILHARFAVRRSKPGAGYGLFATSRIPSGDFILEYKGRHVPTAAADSRKTRYLFEIDRYWTIDGSARSNTARYINHACAPNCEARLQDGRVLISAARTIDRGEELTIDYGQEYFNEFIKTKGCTCDACRPKLLLLPEITKTKSGLARVIPLHMRLWQRLLMR